MDSVNMSYYQEIETGHLCVFHKKESKKTTKTTPLKEMRQLIHTSSAVISAFEKNENLPLPDGCLCNRAQQRPSTSLVSGSRYSAFGVCNFVTSSTNSKWTQPAPSTPTGGPAKKGFVTLSQRVVLMRRSSVRSHSFSFALCLHPLDWVHTQRGSVSQMHADKLAHESERIRFVQRTHALSTSPSVNFPLLHSVSFLLSF